MVQAKQKSDYKKLRVDWKLVEEVAALLEKSITPSAKVELNVKLPVIGKSRRRQCDVVITWGEEPRQITAIVEVQKRNRKPDLNTFHGWYNKMQEVGAQFLICVSMKGYPKSIVDEVKTRFGPTVRLLTLSQLQEPKIPGLIFVSPFIVHKHPHFSIEEAGPGLKVEQQPPITEITLETNDKIFSLNNRPKLYSLNDLAAQALKLYITTNFLQKGIDEPLKYSREMDLGSTKIDLWFHWENKKFKVLRLPIKLIVETKVFQIPLAIFSYRQEFIEGDLAWIAVSKDVINGKDVEIQIVFKPDKNGFLQPVSLKQKGIESINLIFSPDKEIIEAYIAQNLS